MENGEKRSWIFCPNFVDGLRLFNNKTVFYGINKNSDNIDNKEIDIVNIFCMMISVS